MSVPVYAVENLVIDLYTPTLSVRAVDGASFHVSPGETVAIVGESGSGKTVMTLGPLGLMPEGMAVDLRGAARVDGRGVLTLSPSDLSALARWLLRRDLSKPDVGAEPDAEDPHELSGGMLQRAMIALALAARPRVLIADEPTTALDATVQAQILALIRQIQKEDGIAVVLITHDCRARGNPAPGFRPKLGCWRNMAARG